MQEDLFILLSCYSRRSNQARLYSSPDYFILFNKIVIILSYYYSFAYYLYNPMKNQDKIIYQLQLSLQNLFIINPNPKSDYKIRITVNYQITQRNINKIQNKYSFKLQVGNQKQFLSKPFMILLEKVEEKGLYLEVGKGEIDVRQIISKKQDQISLNSIIYGTRAHNHDKIIAKFGYIIIRKNVQHINNPKERLMKKDTIKSNKAQKLPQLKAEKTYLGMGHKSRQKYVMKDILQSKIQSKLAEIEDLKKNLTKNDKISKVNNDNGTGLKQQSKSKNKRSPMYKIEQIQRSKIKKNKYLKKPYQRNNRTSLANQNLSKIQSFTSLTNNSPLSEEHKDEKNHEKSYEKGKQKAHERKYEKGTEKDNEKSNEKGNEKGNEKDNEKDREQQGLAYVYSYSNLFNNMLSLHLNNSQSHLKAICLSNIQINFSSKEQPSQNSSYKQMRSELLLIKIFTFQKQKGQQKKMLQIITPIYYNQLNQILKRQRFFIPKNTLGLSFHIILASNNSNILRGSEHFSYQKTKIVELFDKNKEQRGFIYIQSYKFADLNNFNRQLNDQKQLPVFKELLKHFQDHQIYQIQEHNNHRGQGQQQNRRQAKLQQQRSLNNISKSFDKRQQNMTADRAKKIGSITSNFNRSRMNSQMKQLQTIYNNKLIIQTPRVISFRIINIHFNFYNIFLSKWLRVQFSLKGMKKSLQINLRQHKIQTIPKTLLFTQIPKHTNDLKLICYSLHQQKRQLRLIGQSQNERLYYDMPDQKYKTFIYNENDIIGYCNYEMQIIYDKEDNGLKRYKIIHRSHTSTDNYIYRHKGQELDLELTNNQIYLIKPRSSEINQYDKMQDYQDQSQLIEQEIYE